MEILRLIFLALAFLAALTVSSAADEEIECDDVQGALIIDGVCVCEDPDKIIDSSKSHCITVAFEGYGATCNDTLQCTRRMNVGGVCYENKCRCVDGYHYLHGRCWPDRKYGEKCRSNEECYNYFESDAYECNNGECTCAEGAYKLREQEGYVMCRRIAGENEECETSLDCQSPDLDLVCEKVAKGNNYICMVNPETNTDISTTDPTTNESTTTEPTTTTTEPTTTTTEPTTTTTEPTTTTTEPTTTTTEPTTTAEPCSAEGEMLTDGGDCICKPGYFHPQGSSECVPELGEACSIKEDRPNGHRFIEYASCRYSAKLGNDPDKGVWACLGGFLPGPDNSVCHKTREHTFNCPEGDVQCAFYGGGCVARQCKCPVGFHFASDKSVCWPSTGLDGECNELADCGVTTEDSIECRNKTCKCKSNYHPASGDCRPDAMALGEQCTEASDCIFANGDPSVVCNGKRCSCATGYFSIDNLNCKSGPGGLCTTLEDCWHANNTRCNETTGKCECYKNYVPRDNFRGCLPVATEYGQECEDTNQCTPLTPDQEYLIYCLDVCACISTHHFYNNSCWKTSKLNEKCDLPSNCKAEHSVCRNGYCACEYDHRADGENCIPNNAPSGWTTTPFFAFFLMLSAYLLH